MDLKRLRTFVAVADLRTVSKAALPLRISQSALSRQISDLEYECGFKLFDRVGRRLFLTTRSAQTGARWAVVPALTDEVKSRNAKNLDRRRPIGSITSWPASPCPVRCHLDRVDFTATR